MKRVVLMVFLLIFLTSFTYALEVETYKLYTSSSEIYLSGTEFDGGGVASGSVASGIGGGSETTVTKTGLPNCLKDGGISGGPDYTQLITVKTGLKFENFSDVDYNGGAYTLGCVATPDIVLYNYSITFDQSFNIENLVAEKIDLFGREFMIIEATANPHEVILEDRNKNILEISESEGVSYNGENIPQIKLYLKGAGDSITGYVFETTMPQKSFLVEQTTIEPFDFGFGGFSLSGFGEDEDGIYAKVEVICRYDPNPLELKDLTCTDSDGGGETQSQTKGTVEVGANSFTDICLNEDFVREFVCPDKNNDYYEDTLCSEGCEDGACLIESPECTTNESCPEGEYCDSGICKQIINNTELPVNITLPDNNSIPDPVEPEDFFYCFDSEEENDYFSSGSVTASSSECANKTFFDTCLSDLIDSEELGEVVINRAIENGVLDDSQKNDRRIILETICANPIPSDTYICDGENPNIKEQYFLESYICENGCVDGKCVDGCAGEDRICPDGICRSDCSDVSVEDCKIGCVHEDTCLASGDRLDGIYCEGIQRRILLQKDVGDFCEENYECASNNCQDNKCTEKNSNLLLYLIVGGGILIVVVVFSIVIYFAKKGQTEY